MVYRKSRAREAVDNVGAPEGFEWLYVLPGRMRLILGNQDLELEAGEAAEFDTQVPHWFGSTGEGPAEVLSIFGRPGERMLVRASGHDLDDDEGSDDPHD